MKTMKRIELIVACIIFILSITYAEYAVIGYTYRKGLEQGVSNNQATQLGITKSQDLRRSAVTHDNLMILINERRLSKRLSQLNTDPTMDGYAKERADKVNSTGQCNHDGFTELVDKTGYLSVSEIISCNNTNSLDILTKFSLSPTHNDIMMNPDNKNIGIGISGAYVVIWFWRY